MRKIRVKIREEEEEVIFIYSNFSMKGFFDCVIIDVVFDFGFDKSSIFVWFYM